jgi:AAHS family benzoate transporter-like MFS transporter
MSLPLEKNFMAISIPAVVAGLAIALVNHSRSASVHSGLQGIAGAGEPLHAARPSMSRQ